MEFKLHTLESYEQNSDKPKTHEENILEDTHIKIDLRPLNHQIHHKKQINLCNYNNCGNIIVEKTKSNISEFSKKLIIAN